MSTATQKSIRCEWGVSVQPTTSKLLRGLIYTLFMGIVSLVVVIEGDKFSVVMGITYVIGALLVFGIDVKRIEAGPVTIEFEDNSENKNHSLDDWES